MQSFHEDYKRMWNPLNFPKLKLQSLKQPRAKSRCSNSLSPSSTLPPILAQNSRKPVSLHGSMSRIKFFTDYKKPMRQSVEDISINFAAGGF